MVKTIQVSDEAWKWLTKRKADLGAHDLNDVVESLILDHTTLEGLQAKVPTKARR